MRTPGGTPGGLGTFVVGLIMTVIGGYLFTQNVKITTGFWADFYGYNSFGITLIPLIFGIGFLFFDYKSVVGWVLLSLGGLVIFAGVIMNLRMHWRQTSLFELVVMLVLLVGGLGTLARSLFPMGKRG